MKFKFTIIFLYLFFFNFNFKIYTMNFKPEKYEKKINFDKYIYAYPFNFKENLFKDNFNNILQKQKIVLAEKEKRVFDENKLNKSLNELAIKNLAKEYVSNLLADSIKSETTKQGKRQNSAYKNKLKKFEVEAFNNYVNLAIFKDFSEYNIFQNDLFSINRYAVSAQFYVSLSKLKESNFITLVSTAILLKIFEEFDFIKKQSKSFLNIASKDFFFETLKDNYAIKKINNEFVLLIPKKYKFRDFFKKFQDFNLSDLCDKKNIVYRYIEAYSLFFKSIKLKLNLKNACEIIFDTKLIDSKLFDFDFNVYIMGHGEEASVVGMNYKATEISELISKFQKICLSAFLEYFKDLDKKELNQFNENYFFDEANNFKSILELFNDKLKKCRNIVLNSCYNSGKKIKNIYGFDNKYQNYFLEKFPFSIINIGINYDSIKTVLDEKVNYNDFFSALSLGDYFKSIDSILLYKEGFNSKDLLVDNIIRYFLIKPPYLPYFIAKDYSDKIFSLGLVKKTAALIEKNALIDLSNKKDLIAILLSVSDLDKITLIVNMKDCKIPFFVPIDYVANDYEIEELIINVAEKEIEEVKSWNISLKDEEKFRFFVNFFLIGEDKNIKIKINKVKFIDKFQNILAAANNIRF